MRIFVTTQILGVSILFTSVPEITGKVIIAYFLSVMLIEWIAKRLVFRRELRGCIRLNYRLSFQTYYQQMADRHSDEGLVLRLIGCIGFVICGLWIELGAQNSLPGFGIICSVYFGAIGVILGYALNLKRSKQRISEQDAAALWESVGKAD